MQPRLSRRTIITLITTLILLLTFVLPVFAQDAVASVNTGALNMRSGPGLGHGSIATLPYGFGVQLVARNSASSWVLISTSDGTQGWVNVNYLYTRYPVQNLPVNDSAPASNITPTATVQNVYVLNVRTRPDPNAEVITTITHGTQLTLLGRNHNSSWANVRLSDGRTGWVIASSLVATVPVRSLGLADGSVYAPPPPTKPTIPTIPAQPAVRYHTVVAGDTLAKIGARYGVNMYTLAAANNIYNINLIYTGQRLWIP